MKDLEESTLKVYGKNYWSRLIPLDGFLMGQQERYLIGPDMVQEVDRMYRIDIDTIPDWHPTWDPVEFQQHHPQPSIEQHRFSHEMLETMAIKTMIIRQKIMAKAERMKSLRPIIVRPNI